MLPPIIQTFRERYPNVQFHLHRGTSEQIAAMAEFDRIDFAIATGSQSLFGKYALLPCYRWHRRIVVPKGHPLAAIPQPTIEELAAYPIGAWWIRPRSVNARRKLTSCLQGSRSRRAEPR